jgi:hypothetical protein
VPVFSGYKTYLVAIVGGIVTVVYLLGGIEWHTYEGILGLLGFSGLATLRAAVHKVPVEVKKVDPKP